MLIVRASLKSRVNELFDGILVARMCVNFTQEAVTALELLDPHVSSCNSLPPLPTITHHTYTQ